MVTVVIQVNDFFEMIFIDTAESLYERKLLNVIFSFSYSKSDKHLCNAMLILPSKTMMKKSLKTKRK